MDTLFVDIFKEVVFILFMLYFNSDKINLKFTTDLKYSTNKFKNFIYTGWASLLYKLQELFKMYFKRSTKNFKSATARVTLNNLFLMRICDTIFNFSPN